MDRDNNRRVAHTSILLLCHPPGAGIAIKRKLKLFAPHLGTFLFISVLGSVGHA
jgi:hypothetical protein